MKACLQVCVSKEAAYTHATVDPTVLHALSIPHFEKGIQTALCFRVSGALRSGVGLLRAVCGLCVLYGRCVLLRLC